MLTVMISKLHIAPHMKSQEDIKSMLQYLKYSDSGIGPHTPPFYMFYYGLFWMYSVLGKMLRFCNPTLMFVFRA